MKKMKITGLLFAVLAVLMFAGCSNEIDDAIKLLGGSEADQQEARDIISMSVDDPLPSLTKAIKDNKLSVQTRVNVAGLIGGTCEKMGEEWIEESPVPMLVEVIGGSEEEVKLAIVGALSRIPGDDSLKALQLLLDSDDAAVSETAWNVLDTKAKEYEARANELSNVALDRKIELITEAVAVNPRNQELSKKLAAFYVVKGDMDKAREIFNFGGKYVTGVKVIGPMGKKDLVDPAGFDTSGTVTLGNGSEIKWFDFTDVPENGFIDFRKSRNTKISRSVFYAAFNIEAELDLDVIMKVHSRSAINIWVDGEEVFTADPKEIRKKNEHEIPLAVKKGTTPVLVKLRSKKYARFAIRISDKNHLKSEAIDYSH